MSEKILIKNPKEYQASTGEILELHFNILSMPVLDKLQMNYLKSQVEKDKHLKILDVEKLESELIITVKIVDNPFQLIAIVVSVSAVLSTFFIMNSLGNVYKLVETPSGKLAVNAASIGIIAGAIALGTALLRKG